MLAWILAVAVCLSVTSQSSVEMAEQIGLFFSMRASFHLSYTVVRKFGYLQNKGTSSGTVLQTKDI